MSPAGERAAAPVNPWRRKTGWLALLAVLLYAFAPVLAAAAPSHAPAAPACSTSAEEHQCACRVEAHGAKACCCKPGEAEGGCRMTSSPCGPDQHAALTALWTFSHPLPLPAAALRLRAPARPAVLSAGLPAGPPAAAADPLTPPPQARRFA